MITNVSLISVWVTDLDDTLAFYTDVLGFEAKDDITLGEDFRWVTVGHPSQPELDLHLTTPSSPLSEDLIAAMKRAQADGGLPGVGLHVDDCRATYQELKAKGVEFIQEPQDRPYGSRPSCGTTPGTGSCSSSRGSSRWRTSPASGTGDDDDRAGPRPARPQPKRRRLTVDSEHQ